MFCKFITLYNSHNQQLTYNHISLIEIGSSFSYNICNQLVLDLAIYIPMPSSNAPPLSMKIKRYDNVP